MKSIKGTRTSSNLMKAFAGESQARNRYTYYASQAKKEGFVQISNIFTETAANEKEHAERFFKFLKEEYIGENIKVEAEYPVGLGSTLDNLGYAADGEKEEWTKLYPTFGDIAEEEGFKDIAACFREITKVEKVHEARYRKFYSDIKNDKVFTKDCEVDWKCNNCGYIYTGKSAPKVCPACLHPQSYFEVKCKCSY